MVLKIAYYNFWKDKNNDDYFTRFLQHHLNDTIEVVNPFKCKELDILICSCMGNIKFVKILKAKCKIFFYGENLDRFSPYNNDKLLQDTFDLIVGFKPTNLAEKTIRFPLWLIYYPYYSYQENDNILTYIENQHIINKKIKTRFASLIARHDFGGQRSIIYKALENYGTIDCPSNFNNNCPSIGPNLDDKKQFLKHYKFNICPENSKFTGYHTEKIFHALEAGCIPLYWGIDKPEIDLINENKYCFCHIENTNILQQDIFYCVSNEENYTSGPIFKEGSDAIVNGYYTTLINEIKNFLKN